MRINYHYINVFCPNLIICGIISILIFSLSNPLFHCSISSYQMTLSLRLRNVLLLSKKLFESVQEKVTENLHVLATVEKYEMCS